MPGHLLSFGRHALAVVLPGAAAAATVVAAPAAAAVPAHRHRHGKHPLAHAERRVAHTALGHVGQRYREGATGPRVFDCSGLPLFLYRHVGIHLPRAAEQQYRAARRIARRNARPGDLVFYHSGSYVYHVAVYEGHGWQVAAATPVDGVVHQRIWSSAVTFGRPRA